MTTRTAPLGVHGRAAAEPAQPVSQDRRLSPLDAVPNAGARAILAEGALLAIGPAYMVEAGAYVMACRWDGRTFRVFDACGDWRGTFASWPATDRALAALGGEWDAYVK